MKKNGREKIAADQKQSFFIIKIAIYFSLDLHKGGPNYRSSPKKRTSVTAFWV
jgi:hypothetical protein